MYTYTHTHAKRITFEGGRGGGRLVRKEEEWEGLYDL